MMMMMMMIIIIIIIIIFIYSGMTRRSNFPSVPETHFFCLYCKKRTKRNQRQKGKNVNYN